MVCESFMESQKSPPPLPPLPIFTPRSEDIAEIYPISRIVQEVKDKQDYGTALSQETYYQVSLVPRPSLTQLPVTYPPCCKQWKELGMRLELSCNAYHEHSWWFASVDNPGCGKISCLFSLPLSQKTLPRSSKVGLGTFGKKFKAPEITEEDRIKAACEVKKNTVRSSVMELWRQLQVGRYVPRSQALTWVWEWG